MQKATIEIPDSLRNESNYSLDCEIANTSATGIKENSVWNELKYFHVANNFSTTRCMTFLKERVITK